MKVMIDLSPGKIIRCPQCGKQKLLGETAAIRLGAASIDKRTLAWCKTCGGFRGAMIERMPAAEVSVPDFGPVPSPIK